MILTIYGGGRAAAAMQGQKTPRTSTPKHPSIESEIL
jgi:hypothetical protein